MSKKTNHTTNYPKDSHKQFCLRCFRFNEGCPKTGRKRKAPDCRL